MLVAFRHDIFAGCLTIVWQSGYTPFDDARIPEIVDFSVVPRCDDVGSGPSYWRRPSSGSLNGRQWSGSGLVWTRTTEPPNDST